ncbi:hypothetical protein SISSUDRAFT_1059665 [Sistotremastrum suecicum HHB10207 ss-3]|uniref:Splicing factor Cactin n=1 Tax=Sistotremastrum suecicum HHB10207 ss-3 TaxID=1314776 RepID=A0A166FXJ2_9AGAM|nr:hypothetical protein SISSUDRAFT_1059665 [Sistotremastrum suecicum HHB10207 ss-3]
MPRSRSPTRHSSRRDDGDRYREDRDRTERTKRRHRSVSSDDAPRTRDRSRSRERHKEDSKKKKKREKSAERRARKETKQRLRAEEESRQVAELSVYTATDNPFHDANLGQQFKWHKKAEKEKKMGLSALEAQQRDAQRRAEAKRELEILNKRRAEREIEQQLREEEETRMARLADSAQMADWLAKDGDFQLEQEWKRAGIRLKEKRAKAIDFLALNLKYASAANGESDGLDLEDDGLEIDLDEPYAIFENLSLQQTEELRDDIQRYLTVEKSETNIDFWTNMMVVCEDRLERLNRDRRIGQDPRAADVNAAVESEITGLLSGKNYDQLNLLQGQIRAKLESGEPVDTDYWESLLKSVFVWKAKSKLKAVHEVVVRNRLEQLRKKQRDEALQAQQELLAGVQPDADMDVEGQADEDVPMEEMDGDYVEYRPDMSPPPIPATKLALDDRELEVISEKAYWKDLFTLRHSVAGSRFVAKVTTAAPEPEVQEAPVGVDMASEAMYRAEAERAMEEEEELFNLEENISHPTTYTWEDKYRPRKPRYFNRVHTGYEWNKYNQTHYDTDNPPPKVVQGYKFNIFYPDLIDKSKAPTYKIVREPGNDDTVLLHFTAGPPYEDIAFRVVDREWEYSHKRGFRSSFDRGCLSLWFNFRRNFYRK